MKKTISVIFFLFIIALSTYAQQIEGVITDNQQTPLPYVNVVVKSIPDSVFVTGTTTDASGRFSFQVSQLPCMMQVSFVGYTPLEQVVQTADNIHITLYENVHELDEVIVKSTLPTYALKNGGISAQIAGTVLSTEVSATDILGKLPTITKKNDGFEVFGKGTPLIYINGKKVLDISELDQLNGNQIKSIEIIQNPGAEYDATVKAVIRIKTLPRQREGWGYDVRTQLSQGEKTEFNQTLNLNYRKNGFEIFANTNYRYYPNFNVSTMESTQQTDTIWDMKSDFRYDWVYRYIHGKTGFNFDINEHHSIGMQYDGYKELNLTEIGDWNSFVEANGKYYDHSTSHSVSHMRNKPTHQLNAYYTGITNGWNIDVNANMFAKGTNNEYKIDETSAEGVNREVTTFSDVSNFLTAAKITLSHSLGKGVLMVGSEYTYSYRNDTYLNPEGYLEDSNYSLKEHNPTVFAQYTLDSKWGKLGIGTRYEFLDSRYFENKLQVNDQSRKYNNLFPNLSFSTQAGKVALQFSYTGKTQRPSYRELGGNINYYNRFTVQSGNPKLKPSQIQALQGMANWKYVTGVVEYTSTHNPILYWGIPYGNQSSMTLVYYINSSPISTLKSFVSASPQIDFWHPTVSVGILKQWFNIESINGRLNCGSPLLAFKWTNSFKLKHNWIFNLDLDSHSHGHQDNTFMEQTYWKLDASVLKSWMNDVLSIELKGEDLLYGMGERKHLLTYCYQISQLEQHDTRRARITLRYKFNTSKSRYKGTGAGMEQQQRM